MNKIDNFIKYSTKKSYNGVVSVRSYIIDKAIRQRKDLVIEFEGKIMTISNSKLKDRTQLHSKKFTSKFDGKEYTLYDFWFVSDSEKKKILTLF